MIILLDGSKGAGKTTVGEILVQRLSDTVCLSIDNERRVIGKREGSRAERNREAFEKILEKSEKLLDEGFNIVIDCGWVEDRTARVDVLAKSKNTPIYKFLLMAPYETQLNRVRVRERAKGKETDEERFAEIHKNVHSKEFDDFTIIETDKVNPEEAADMILSIVS